jgi:DNA-binding beta-propeller fold protein YncE
VIGELKVPTSVVGPPQSVAIAPDGSIALVTAAMRIDPADATKTIPDDKVTVIDLKASPPAVLATLHAGSAASGVSINRAGTLALVANRSEGTVSVFTITGKTVTAAGKVDLGAPESGPSLVAITPDGRTALVSRNNDSLISILAIDGTKVTYTKRDIAGGFKPYGIDITPAGDVALVANIGAGATGGTDTVAVIDLSSAPRVVDQVAVGPVPEGLAISPDGRFAALTVMNGSNAPKSSPMFNDFGLLRIFALRNRTIVPVADAKVGHWCQGTAWSGTGSILVQCMVERQIMRFRFDGQRLVPDAPISVSGGPAGIRARQP